MEEYSTEELDKKIKSMKNSQTAIVIFAIAAAFLLLLVSVLSYNAGMANVVDSVPPAVEDLPFQMVFNLVPFVGFQYLGGLVVFVAGAGASLVVLFYGMMSSNSIAVRIEKFSRELERRAFKTELECIERAHLAERAFILKRLKIAEANIVLLMDKENKAAEKKDARGAE